MQATPGEKSSLPWNKAKWKAVGQVDIFWLKDESFEASDNLPDPDVIALEIVEDLEAALEQFREIVGDLGKDK